MVLRTENVTVVRGGATLLDRVSMEVSAGRLLAVVGPNGAGKSTLLRVLANELTPCSGSVHFDGFPLKDHEPRSLARRRAVLRQRFSVSGDFRVGEVVRLGRTPYPSGGHAREDHAIADRLLAEVGLPGFTGRSYATLSGGEQQRVHLARALAQLEGPVTPKLLLLDEPSSSLDPRQQHEVLSLVSKRVRAGYAAVAVLHDLSLAARYADDVVVLCRGNVAAKAPMASLDEATIRAVFRVEVTKTAGRDGATQWLVEGPSEDRDASERPHAGAP